MDLVIIGGTVVTMDSERTLFDRGYVLIRDGLIAGLRPARPSLSDAVIRGMLDTGIRGVFVRGYIDYGEEYGVPPALIQSTDDVLTDCDRVAKRYRGAANGRIH